MNLAAPDCGVSWENPTEARGVSSVIGMGVGRLPTGVGIAGELSWIVSSESLNGGLELAVVDEVGEGGRERGRLGN